MVALRSDSRAYNFENPGYAPVMDLVEAKLLQWGLEKYVKNFKGRHEATGYPENRLRYVRRKDQNKTKKSVRDPHKPSKLVDTTDLELISDDAEECVLSAMVTCLETGVSQSL
ncbi:hypothetical protein BSL78_26352 [Apostichopus japonicus]|uniref:Uncharacterized protein n=1 Tax=Stichopus japonicus TaxID=307972 RepID=A0A2G8JM94_STIJA|nr:hypothetical protein BSL78_26352 [Apostichopus japonicus]